MSKTRSFRLVMVALAVILIAGLVLGSAVTARASAPPTNCSDLFVLLNYCDTTYAQNSAQLQICRNNVYAAAASINFDTSVCYGGPCGDDGRVNTNCSAPEIVYCDEDTVDFFFYNYFTGEGEFDFQIDTDDLLQSVNVKTLLVRNGAVKVYLRPDGLVEMLAPQTDGKIYFMLFDPYDCVSVQESAEWGLK